MSKQIMSTLSELVDGGGILRPAQAQRFIRRLVERSELLRLATVVPLDSTQRTVRVCGLGGRDPSSVDLHMQCFQSDLIVSDGAMEDIQRGDILEMVADAMSRDLDEVLIQGDTTWTDPFLATMDGVLRQATSHVVDAAGAHIASDRFRKVVQTLPMHLRDESEVSFLVSLRQAAVLLCRPKNIHVGIYQHIRMDTEWDPSESALRIVMTLRVGVAFADEAGAAKITNVRCTHGT